jgi:hypothetical protein
MTKQSKKFLTFDGKVMVISGDDIELSDKLNGGIYTLKYSKEVGLYLEGCDAFDMPDKLYGDIINKFERITASYASSNKSLGILLSGVKGSGKTLLAKLIGNHYASSVPVILVNQAFPQEMLVNIVTVLEDGVFIFDEFDKTFWDGSEDAEGDEPQHGLLTLLDGLYSSKKMFIFTCNERSKISDFLIHRPSRVRYLFNYDVLETSIVEEIAGDMLANKLWVEDVVVLADIYGTFTYDTLKALIDEVNTFNIRPLIAIQGMNIQCGSGNGLRVSDKYDVRVVDSHDNVLWKSPDSYDYWDKPEINPLGNASCAFVYDGDENKRRVMFSVGQLIKYNKQDKVLTYDIGDSEFLMLEKIDKPATLSNKDLERVL